MVWDFEMEEVRETYLTFHADILSRIREFENYY